MNTPSQPTVRPLATASCGPLRLGARRRHGERLRGAARLLLSAALALAPLPSVAQEAATPEAPAAQPAPEPTAPTEPAPPSLFYFFSPDWRPPDLGRLGSAIETALANGGVRVTFQAFTRYEDFERHLTEKPPTFLIAPAWLRSSGSGAFPHLTVVAVPSRRGHTGYRKALMSRPGIESVDGLARGSVAATLHATDDNPPSEVLAPFHLRGDSTRLVPVPKDVDALLALSFGQVDGALVTGEQYEQLALSNPAEAARLRVLAFSPEVPLPPVFAMAGVDAALVERLRERLLRLGDDPDGASALALLGFDAFVAEPPPPAPAKAGASGGPASSSKAKAAGGAGSAAKARPAAKPSARKPAPTAPGGRP